MITGTRTFAQDHDDVKYGPKIPVTAGQIAHVFRQVLMPYVGTLVTAHMIVEGHSKRLGDYTGTIHTVTSQGLCIQVSGRVSAWTTFISWVDLWTEHVRLSGSPVCEELDVARQWLVGQSVNRVIDLGSIRAARDLEAIV